MRGTSGVFSRRWIEGTSFYGGSGLTEEREKVSPLAELGCARINDRGSIYSTRYATSDTVGLVQGRRAYTHMGSLREE